MPAPRPTAFLLGGLVVVAALGVLQGRPAAGLRSGSAPADPDVWQAVAPSIADPRSADHGGPAVPQSLRTPTPVCEITHDKRAGPPIASLGDTIEVSLTTRARCSAPRLLRVHIVLVMDESEAMSGQPIRHTKAAAQALVNELKLEDFPSTYVGVVAFGERARRLVGLTNDPASVRRAIHRVEAASGDARLDLGLAEALRVHARGESRSEPDWTTKVVILYSLGPPSDRCEEALRASRQVRGAGILVITVCAGPSCNQRCMRDIAASPRYFFEVGDVRLMDVIHQIRHRFRIVVVRSLVVSDTLSSDLAYVPGSARPAPTAIGPSGRWLQWHDVYVPRDGVTYTFRAKPLRLGALSTNEGAEGEVVINTGERVAWRFAVPTVVVVEPSPTPTPAATATTTPRFVPMTPPVASSPAPGPELYLPTLSVSR